ncbi:MAG: sulfite exporter TauE/SafE family protein [Bacteroidota bacterium]
MAPVSLIAGFTLGVAGSLHCVGMCGPLSMALPTWHLSSAARFFSLLLYQFGRIITYSLFGLIFGLAGRSIYFAGFQQWFSITAGCVFIIAAALYFIQRNHIRISIFNRFYILVQRVISGLLKNNSTPPGFLLLGMANGLLPCGMVYMAIAAALSFPQLSQSIGFMAMFGAGTLPTMLLASYGGQIMKPGIRNLFKKSVPFAIIVVGVMLILRGMNLGIEFISPEMAPVNHVIVCSP